MKRFDASQGPRIVGPRDGKSVELGAIGARFIVWGEESGGGFSLVEHPIPPRTLAAPVHRHSRGTSTATSWRVGWERCSATTWSTPKRATSPSSRVTNGTRSGTPATPSAGSSRSSRRRGSSTISTTSRRLRCRARSSPRATARGRPRPHRRAVRGARSALAQLTRLRRVRRSRGSRRWSSPGCRRAAAT